ncbi:WD40/YVTN/BNR-like repeat-containing protein [Fibrella aestuarina]|nr:oxidoreductase [Fibrella aestuarina]
MYARYLTLLAGLFLTLNGFAQWQPQSVGTTAHFRSISVPSATVAWIGGTKGTFVRTIDGGRTWQAGNVPNADACDFRDVKAFDGQTAFLMSAGPAEKGQARIYKTTDGGQTWTIQYQTEQPGVFFDSMDFWDRQHGMAVSDPVEGRWFIVKTDDGGRTWQRIPAAALPPMEPNEAAFAASGTNLIVQGSQHVWLVSGGGPAGRVFRSTDRGRTWAVSTTPIPGGEMTGPVGMQFQNKDVGMIVGGTFKPQTEQPQPNAAITRDGGRTWQPVTQLDPAGLKESVAFLPGNRILVVGSSGTTLSADGGRTWQKLDTEPYYSVACVGNTCYVVGAKGRVAKRVFK